MITQEICEDCRNSIVYTLKEKVYVVQGDTRIDKTRYVKCKYNIEAKEEQLYKSRCIVECSLRAVR